MSRPLDVHDVLFRQRILACSGFSPGPLDGDWGPKTDKAESDFEAAAVEIKESFGVFDTRTEGCIATLTLQAQKMARRFMTVCGKQTGIVCKIISGTRTYAEQTALYNQGRSAPGQFVTNAPAGSSNHNFGIAWDVGIWKGGRYLTGEQHGDEQAYIDLAHAIKAAGLALEWGGDWHSIVDRPHYQLPTGKSLQQVRQAFEGGQSFMVA